MRIAIVAGEPSGDILAASLMKDLRCIVGSNIEFYGVGGTHMLTQGLISFYDISVLSVVGFGLDLLCKLPRIIWIKRQLVKKIIAIKPDVFIGVDAPDFNLRLSYNLKQSGIKVVHYISPSIWAWRYSRIYKIKRSVDYMLCVFPMEESLYAAAKVPAKFVGHSLAEDIPYDTREATKNAKLQLNVSQPVITVLPGSRISETNSLSEVLISACEIIQSQLIDVIFLFPLISEQHADLLRVALNGRKIQYKILVNNTRTAIYASDFVIAKSGTVTLEVACCKKPCIIVYKVSKLTEFIVRRLITTKFVGLPNIILNHAVVPELLCTDATSENIAHELMNLYFDYDRQQYMLVQFMALHIQLRCNLDKCAAKAILNQ